MFILAARRGQNDWWRWLLMIGFIVVGITAGSFPISAVALQVAEANGTEAELSEYFASMNPELLGMDPKLNLALLILPFACALAAMLVGVRILHERPAASLISALDRVDWKRVAWAFGVWLGLALLIEGLAFAASVSNYTVNLGLDWISLLLVCLLLIPLQTSAEEVFFRGYLWQGIGLLAPAGWVPLVITTVLFSVPHLANPEAAEYGWFPSLLLYVGAGLLLGSVTLLDDRLELALGIHAATNIFAAAFVSYKAAVIQTPALLVANDLNIWLAVAVFYLAAALFLWLAHRRYGLLGNWREKLFSPLTKIEKEPPVSDEATNAV